ncbi:MAG TPA: SMI1/KNR4 family protein, partial [Kofleriaceae bacterium]|nr:SMI1/KNR4 family protein [Kofleriaceae bacterium]
MTEPAEPAARVREALAALAARDPARRVFGAAHHRYELAPPLSAGELGAAERALGAELPDELRAFAREVG